MLRALVVVVGVLAVAAPGRGALVLRISISPSRPHAGQLVGIGIRTYVPIADRTRHCGFRRVARRSSYPFVVEAVGPDGAVRRVRVNQRRGNLYAGRFRPRLPGRWTIRVANFGPSYPRCSGSRVSFRVSR